MPSIRPQLPACVHARACAHALIASLAALAPAVFAAPQDMLATGGPQAGRILDLWHLAEAICAVVFVAILVAFALALWRAPRGNAETPADVSGLAHVERGPRRSVSAGIAVSIVLLLALLVGSVVTDRALARLPLRDALHIELTGHQWWWSARYDDEEPSKIFTTANELHIPVGRPVILTLRADDVIHTVWLPNLAGKKDLIPGRTASLTLRADKPGVYRGQCAEFCGYQHAWMALFVTADPPERYEAWAAQQREPAPPPHDAQAVRGQQIFLGSTCVMCHAIGGTEAGAQVGPDLTHLAGRGTIASGRLPNDAQHLASWIENPQAHKRGVNMPSHAFSQDDLQALVAYLRSLQ